MSELEAKNLLKSAQDFIRSQRDQRLNETRKGYQIHGSHVTVGETKPLLENFVASDKPEPARR